MVKHDHHAYTHDCIKQRRPITSYVPHNLPQTIVPPNAVTEPSIGVGPERCAGQGARQVHL